MAERAAYREPASLSKPNAKTSLVLGWRGVDRRRSGISPFALVLAVVPAVATATGMVTASAAVISMAAGSAIMVAWARWAIRDERRRSQIVLAVKEGVLELARGGDSAPRRVPVASIREVELDRKTSQRVFSERAVGGARTSTSVYSKETAARIVLLVDAGEPVRLTDEHASYDECIDRFGKVRQLLRAHGWQPENERGVQGTGAVAPETDGSTATPRA